VIRIVIADDHPIVLDALVQLFALERDIEVAGRCGDGDEALELIRRFSPDVAVLDVRMAKRDGLSVVRAIVAEGLTTRAVLLTAQMNDDEVLEAVSLGVGAIVLKETASRRIVQAVRTVAAGEHLMDEHVVRRALDRMLRREAGTAAARRVLTAREIEIVRMVATGLRNKAIADALSIAEGTVKIHLHSIYEKLGVTGRVELTLYAQEKSLA